MRLWFAARRTGVFSAVYLVWRPPTVSVARPAFVTGVAATSCVCNLVVASYPFITGVAATSCVCNLVVASYPHYYCFEFDLIPMLRPLCEGPPRKRLRGGHRQRLAQGEGEEEAEVAPPSKLACGHLLEWADGDSSAQRLLFHMKNAYDDGMRHPMITRLSKIPGGKRAQEGMKALCHELGLGLLQTVLPIADAVTRTLSAHRRQH